MLEVHRDDKFPVTAMIANREGRTIIFVRTQHGVPYGLCKQLGPGRHPAGRPSRRKLPEPAHRNLAEFHRRHDQRPGLHGRRRPADIHVDNIRARAARRPAQDHI
ncbi:hypothetical protein [Streptosporangium vulgare]|uniref:hypothetical protein n=1 Tax=Streptosporangium vulgare TaxID=46190 RepID=UPI0031D8F85D